jgi:hypothetical protein
VRVVGVECARTTLPHERVRETLGFELFPELAFAFHGFIRLDYNKGAKSLR